MSGARPVVTDWSPVLHVTRVTRVTRVTSIVYMVSADMQVNHEILQGGTDKSYFSNYLYTIKDIDQYIK